MSCTQNSIFFCSSQPVCHSLEARGGEDVGFNKTVINIINPGSVASKVGYSAKKCVTDFVSFK